MTEGQQAANARARKDVKDAVYWRRIEELIDRCPPIEPEYAAQLRAILAPAAKPPAEHRSAARRKDGRSQTRINTRSLTVDTESPLCAEITVRRTWCRKPVEPGSDRCRFHRDGAAFATTPDDYQVADARERELDIARGMASNH